MSASASAPSSPGYHVMSTAPARDAQGMSTGEPALTTTTVRGLTSSTASTSSRWRPGSDRSGRSCPSDSHCPLEPTTTTATSAAAAAATARSNSSPVSGGRRPDPRPHDRGRGRARPDLHGQLVGAAGGEVDRHLDGLAAGAVEARAPDGLGVVDDDLAVEAEHGPPGALEPEPPRPGDVRVEGRGQPDRARPDGELRPRRADPQRPGPCGPTSVATGVAGEVRVVEVRDAHASRRPAGAGRSTGSPGRSGTPPRRRRTASGQPLGQRLVHPPPPVRGHLGAAAAHGELARHWAR